MNFPYSSIISSLPSSTDFVLLHRPEIPVTIIGPNDRATFLALVDTGSDHTIFPRSVAEHLGVVLSVAEDFEANVFGGHQVRLLSGDVNLELESEGDRLNWPTVVSFFDSAEAEDVVILGHSGFLDFFTATFDGKAGILTLVKNDQLPTSE